MRKTTLLIWMLCSLVCINRAMAQALIYPSDLALQFTDSMGRYCEWESLGYRGIPNYLCTCSNLDAAKTTQTNALWPGGSLGLSLSGTGLNKLGLWDGGRARTSHIEFGSRIMVMDSLATLSGHSTAVAGNLIAAGINPAVRGMSYQTQLKNWNFTNDNAEIIAAAPDLFASNHSYATTAAFTNIGGNWYWYGDTSLHPTRDWKFGYYDNRSRIWDSVMHANPYYLMVKASGNDRGNAIAPGTPHYYWNGTAWALSTSTRDTVGPYDCISTFGNAKNIICVGAIPVMPNGFSGNINTLSFSTWGPTDDGRIKPDLVGSSGSILSVGSASDSAYAGLGGTSIAAPNITGSILLLQQYWHQLKGRYALNSTVKALAIHSAKRCQANAWGPDYSCGWGVPNFSLAAETMRDSVKNSVHEINLLNLDSFETFVYLNPTDTLKSTLVWTDPKGITAAPVYNDPSLKLVNDLDMRVYTLSDSMVAMPFVLNPANPAMPASTGDNFRDNVEQIIKTALPSAWYKIKIKHKGTLQFNQAQRFSLVLSGSRTLTALPVGYSDLAAKQISTTEIQVHWSTVQEINNQRFELYAGSGADQLLPIASLPGRGNSNKIQHYGWINKNPRGFAGTQYYQIKQIDYDGKFSWSKLLSVTIENPLRIEQVVPNPFNKEVVLYYSAAHAAVAKVYSATGKLLAQTQIEPHENGRHQLDLNELQSGIYFLVLQDLSTQQSVSFKLVKE